MNKLVTMGLVSLLLASITIFPAYSQSTVSVPPWVKGVADFWCQERIEDFDFVSGIQFLIEEGRIQIENTGDNDSTEQKIPDWVRVVACSWSQDSISDGEFVNGIAHLVKIGVIVIPIDDDEAAEEEAAAASAAEKEKMADPDGDGIKGNADQCPNEYGTQANGCPKLLDADNDGITDSDDPCPQDPQNDSDNDNVCGNVDSCPNEYGTQANGCPKLLDADNDGITDTLDNCRNDKNSNQQDTDRDGIGDVCDPRDDTDSDNDGITDTLDNCRNDKNSNQQDTDRDGIGDVCDPRDDTDSDNDGITDTLDNCRNDKNSNQQDTDRDGIGDVCDPRDDTDSDNDGITDTLDNCRNDKNSNQQDTDRDGIGDVCDPRDDTDSDNDGITDSDDPCPQDPQNDSDNDNVCGNVDSCPNEYGTQSDGCPVPIPPVADIQCSSTNIQEGGTMECNASGSYDSDGEITRYDWIFGDGANGSGEIITHSYTNAGTYTIVLTVTDNDGLTDVKTDTVEVKQREKFEGTWNNDDSNTGGITKITIDQDDSTVNVHAWGACSPTDCDWGTVTGTANNAGNSAVVVYTKNFAITTLTLTITDGNKMRVDSVTAFIDDSGRDTQQFTYYFTKQLYFIAEPIERWVVPSYKIK